MTAQLENLSTTCWAPIAARVIVLEKFEQGSGSLPIGSTYRWTYKSLNRFAAMGKASKALLRDHPDEDRTNWREAAE